MRDWAVRPIWASCYSWAALFLIDSKTRYSTHSKEDCVCVVVGEGEQEERNERSETAVEDGRAHLSQGGRSALLPVKRRKVE